MVNFRYFLTLLAVAVYCKVKIQPAEASESTDEEIWCMHKYVMENKAIRRYTETLALKTGATTVHSEYNKICIYIIEAK